MHTGFTGRPVGGEAPPPTTLPTCHPPKGKSQSKHRSPGPTVCPRYHGGVPHSLAGVAARGSWGGGKRPGLRPFPHSCFLQNNSALNSLVFRGFTFKLCFEEKLQTAILRLTLDQQAQALLWLSVCWGDSRVLMQRYSVLELRSPGPSIGTHMGLFSN
ncbi:hypothetical protein ACRRTK_009633 [Alexandromys fortis]